MTHFLLPRSEASRIPAKSDAVRRSPDPSRFGNDRIRASTCSTGTTSTACPAFSCVEGHSVNQREYIWPAMTPLPGLPNWIDNLTEERTR